MVAAYGHGARQSLLSRWGCALLGAALLAGCASSPQQPAVGLWELSNPHQVGEQSTSLQLSVSRLECASGETGDVLEPEVVYETDRIVIRTDVEPLPPGNYNCLENETVPLTVQLSEPVGEREIVDAACLQGEALDTTFCVDGGVRWQPQQEDG